MLKVPYKRLRPNSKGGLNDKHSKCGYQHKSKLHIANVGNKVLQGIPVLSIFALVGIVTYGLTISGASLFNGANKVSAAETITASSSDGNSTISFTIAGADKTEQVSAGRGSTIYRAHTITLNASNIESYALTISGNPNMINPSGSTTSNTITSTNGTVNGTNLASNTWGYYYGEYNTTNGNNKESVVYKPLVSTGTTIDTGKPTNYTITNQTKNLVFAAKFGEDIAQGRYYANVDLSVTATPATLVTYSIIYEYDEGAVVQKTTTANDSYQFTIGDYGECYDEAASECATPVPAGVFRGWNTNKDPISVNEAYAPGKTITLTENNPSITLYPVISIPWDMMYSMQTMTPLACSEAAVGASITLTDTRDKSSYTVKKLADGNCWMVQNLRLVNKTISSADSDMVSGSFMVPASSATGFSDNTAANAVYSGNTNYGSYYSWCAATAGTCNMASVAGEDVTASICPKGWTLPKGGADVNMNDFAKVFGYTVDDLASDPNVFSLVGATFSGGRLYHTGTNWVASGNYNNSTSDLVGTGGYYWSRTAYSSTRAYRLGFGNKELNLAGQNSRANGFSVRCVAYSS